MKALAKGGDRVIHGIYPPAVLFPNNSFRNFRFAANALADQCGAIGLTEQTGISSASGRASCYAVVYNSFFLSRDFQVSGSLLRCMTATMSKVSSLTW